MRISYVITCDGYNEVICGSHISAAAARKQAKRYGELFRVGRKEYCKRCFLALKKGRCGMSNEKAFHEWYEANPGECGACVVCLNNAFLAGQAFGLEAAAKFVEDGATATAVPMFAVEIVSGATIVKDLRYEVAKGIRMLKREGEDE